MNIELETFKNDKFEVNTSHIFQQNAKGTVFVFPGAGYSFMGPCIYYPSELLYKAGYNLFNFEYDFRRMQHLHLNKDYFREFFQFLMGSIEGHLVSNNKIVLTKSIGTRIVAAGDEKHFDKYIWLTPALNDQYVSEKMIEHSSDSIFVIGDKDHFYEQNIIDQLQENSVSSLIVPNADHGLDIGGDPYKSIEGIKSILKELDNFIQ